VLRTNASLPAGILSISATFAAVCISYMEDQYSIRPSDLLVIFFSALSILSAARLRSLWLLQGVIVCKVLCTIIFILFVALMFVESLRKTKILRSPYDMLGKEETSGFWDRSFFTWVFPMFRKGYSSILSLADIPDVDEALKGRDAGQKLQAAWNSSSGSRRLLKSVLLAYRWSWFSAVIPRLCLTVFSFAQPFLINATLRFLSQPTTKENENYGRALIGAYVFVYLGFAVSLKIDFRYRHTQIRTDINRVVLAGSFSPYYYHASWLNLFDL
jgi:ATP-binding cassette, subfamily C (CFTR/MRP), member 1